MNNDGIQPKKDEREEKKDNRLLIIIIVLVVILLLAGAFVDYILSKKGLVNSRIFGRENSGSSSELTDEERNNTLLLAQSYIDMGLYDDALKLLNGLLISDASDKDAQDMLSVAAKRKQENSSLSDSYDGSNSLSDTDGNRDNSISGRNRRNNSLNDNGYDDDSYDFQSENAYNEMQSTIDSLREELARQNAENRKNNEVMASLLDSVSNEKAVEEENRRQEEAEKQAQAEAENQRRQQEEQKRKAEEERISAENAAKAKALQNINDEIAKGTEALKRGDIEEALKHFRNAQNEVSQLDDPNMEASKLSEIANTLYDSSENMSQSDAAKAKAAASQFAKDAVEENPADSSSHYLLAMDYMDKKDWANAEKELSKASSGDSTNYMYYYQLGRALANQKKYSEAATAFQSCIKCNDSFAPAQYNLGFVSERLNKNKQALAAYKKAYEINPDYENAYIAAARIQSKTSDYKGAAETFGKAISVNPSNAKTYQEQGAAYSSMGSYAKAEESFKKALAYMDSSKPDPVTYYNLSTVMMAQGKTKDAVAYAKQSYDLCASTNTKTKASITYNYALVSEMNGEEDKAISLYNEVIKIDPKNIKALTNLAALCLDSSDYDTAIQLLKVAYTVDDKNFEVNNNLGNAYGMSKQYDEAIKYYKSALKIQTNNNTVRANLARTYVYAQQYDSAKVTFEDVVKANPEDWESWLELGKVCMSMGDNESAEKYLVYLQAKNPGYQTAEVSALLQSLN